MRLLNEIARDLEFVRSHTLQPGWYKILKVFIVLGFLLGYTLLFGILKTLIFFITFMFLSLVVHMIYRIKTDAWTKSWLDFIVVEENNQIRPKSIGRYYYSAVVMNAIIAIVVSQMWA